MPWGWRVRCGASTRQVDRRWKKFLLRLSFPPARRASFPPLESRRSKDPSPWSHRRSVGYRAHRSLSWRSPARPAGGSSYRQASSFLGQPIENGLFRIITQNGAPVKRLTGGRVRRSLGEAALDQLAHLFHQPSSVLVAQLGGRQRLVEKDLDGAGANGETPRWHELVRPSNGDGHNRHRGIDGQIEPSLLERKEPPVSTAGPLRSQKE